MATTRRTPTPRYPQIAAISRDALVARRVDDIIDRAFGHRGVIHADRIDDDAIARAIRAGIDLAVVDTPTADAAEPILKALRDQRPDLPVIALLREPSLPAAVDLIEHGAIDVVIHDGDRWSIDLATAIEKSLARAELRRQRDRTELELRRSLATLEVCNRHLEDLVTRLETMAWTDPLTGMANRRQIDQRITQLFAEAARYRSDLTCLMIDLDGLKPINDTFGHPAGDELIQLAARVITDGIRASDLAGRIGGDEFIVLMPRTADRDAAPVARRLSDTFTERAARLIHRDFAPINHPDATACVRTCGMSIGVASLQTSQPLDADTLIANADAALYQAKERGTNHVIVRAANGTYTGSSDANT